MTPFKNWFEMRSHSLSETHEKHMRGLIFSTL